MIRIHFAAAAAVLCAIAHVGCDSGTQLPFKGKTDGAPNAGAGGATTDAGGDGAAAGGASSGGRGPNAGGRTGDAGPTPGACGAVFGHSDACRACLEKNCCDLGTACSKIADCPKLASCIRACDSMTGAPGDQCRNSCTAQFLTGESRLVYNPLVQCMGQSCLNECPFRGP